MTYRIEENATYNSREIYFSGKPSEEVRTALKALKMRWNPKKTCWYGYAAESEIIAAITENTPDEEKTETAVVTEGYLGGGAYYGGNSGKSLYGKDLSSAIRESIKAAGIKGVTVRVESSTYTDSLTVTVRTNPEDIRDFSEFVKDYRITTSRDWICYKDGEKVKDIYKEEYWNMDGESQERIREAAATYEWEHETQRENDINHFYIEKYRSFSDSGLKKLEKINNIILSYRWDESNSMVDYFSTNFYYTIKTKPAA